MKTKINDPSMQWLRAAIGSRLESIQKLLGPDYQLTLIARHATNDESHIMLSTGGERAAIAAAEKLLGESDGL